MPNLSVGCRPIAEHLVARTARIRTREKNSPGEEAQATLGSNNTLRLGLVACTQTLTSKHLTCPLLTRALHQATLRQAIIPIELSSLEFGRIV